MKRFLTFFLIIIVSQSCFIGKKIEESKMNTKFSEENNAIPPDFGKDETTLLVMLKGRKSYDKYLKKYVENIFKGKYIFVEAKDYYSGTYLDREKFRYLFDY